MSRGKRKARRSKRGSVRDRVIARPEVLRRFTDKQLEALEARVSRDIPPAELAALEAAADAAYVRVTQVAQLLRELKRLREARGLTQAQVDERSGIGRANVSRLENAHLENPSLETILRYAQAVGAELLIAVKPRKSPKDAA